LRLTPQVDPSNTALGGGREKEERMDGQKHAAGEKCQSMQIEREYLINERLTLSSLFVP